MPRRLCLQGRGGLWHEKFYVYMKNFNIIPKFIEFLSSRGIEYNIVDDVFIKFNYKDLNYMFQYYKDEDPSYFRIMLPKINNKQVTTELVKITTELNINYKSVKLFEIESNSIWMVIECFVYSLDNIDMLFSRIVDALSTVIKIYRDKEAKL